MLTITNGFTYIAFLMLLAGGLLALEKYMKWKIFNIVPPLVWIYIFNMFFCTIGLYNSDECSAAYSALKNNILYAMIFVMLLRCDFRKLGKLGPRMICIFMGCAITLGIGFFALFPLFANALGGADKTWGATAALYASWVGGSANMAAMEDALPVDSGAYSCALALDTACYSLWIALLLFAVKYAQKWNKACKADTSKLDAVAAAANEEVAKETNVKPNAADWIFLIGLTLVVSAVSQYIGVQMNGFFKGVGLSFFDKGTCTTVFVTILGLICAMTPLGKLPAVTELSSVYLYAVVSLIASTATLIDLLSAPMWVVYGLGILLVPVSYTHLYEGMTKIPGIRVLGSSDPDNHHGILSFAVDGVHPHDVAEILNADNICVRAGHHCAQPLLQYLGTASTTRVSLAFYNTEDEIRAFLTSLGGLRRKMGYE